MALAREWDDLVEQARRLPGFADFLRTPRTSTLLPAAAGGPVVYVNVSRWRCDALIVTTDGVERVQLVRLNAADVVERVRRHLFLRREFEVTAAAAQRGGTVADVVGLGPPVPPDAVGSAVPSVGSAARRARRALDADLHGLTGWLWDVLAQPVLHRLGLLDGPPDRDNRPRLWWCPTGLLTLLPLHAAGHYDDPVGTGPGTSASAGDRAGAGLTVADRVVSSYTPTLRALLRATAAETDAGPPSASASQPPADPRMLIVSLPSAQGRPSLPYAESERDVLQRHFPGEQHTLLEGDAATRAAVETALPRHRWAHFSCHGDQQLGDPSSGGLVLHDRMLRIADIGASHTTREFAFLAACRTATGGVNLPDETISLAAALQHTGYRHVLASLWSVYDLVAARVSTLVYDELMASGVFEPHRSAAALDAAIAELRRAYPYNLSVWTPFTHTGT
ncbi:CHAT domain-containing protein [Frankia sp. AiPs1]|uniref:CHAT domain-containing protein n=1 Tax=Frankia sp. AiPs1 TaxID=573493 RepID=UPI002044A61F|nr:CHAT domain-containing protein [Frankia sp. AiPs1]MCM3921033.1 CHAT domain-containing protein [Frankia sp. AiPs1]